MLEDAYYSVIAPESCAAIIWRDSGKAPLAAAALRLTATDLLQMKLIDDIIPEPDGGAHVASEQAIRAVGDTLRGALRELSGETPEQLVVARYEKFRQMGSFFKEEPS
jgi:acetyl-CoA carboxylase carboxyl transferase subunit alpha